MQGKVKWFSEPKFYGFITKPDGTDRFVHGNDIREGDTLQTGSLVEFDEAPGRGGKMCAKHVRLVRES